MSEAKAKAAHQWEREANNHYVEPTWVTRRLCEVESFTGRVVDPCAGFGHTLKGAHEAGVRMEGFDLINRGNARIWNGHDFFAPPQWHGIWPCDSIISNPPYGRRPKPIPTGEMARYEEHFITLALQRARSKVAVFLLSTWANAESRGKWLETLPLYRIYHVGPRPSCPPGHTILAGEKPGGGQQDFSWYVFLNGFQGSPTVHWLRRDG